VTEFALTPTFVELDVFEMTEVAGSLTHFKFFLLGFVLMAIGAVNLLTLDLVFLLQVWLVNKGYLFGELYLLSLELIIWPAVAIGGHTTGIRDPRSRQDILATQLEVGETLWGFVWNVLEIFCGDRFRNLRYFQGLLGRIVAFNAAVFVVFAFFPEFVAFFYDARIS
jgi:hypothetical protein